MGECFPIPNTSLFINSFMTEVPIIKNQSIDLLLKSMDWFLYDRELHHQTANIKATYHMFS